jgi:dUTP pyrophosphatase
VEVKIKKLNSNAVLPSYAKRHDGCVDLVATSKSFTKNYYEYGTGLAIEIPRNFVGLIFPRSSISNMGLSLCNSVGVIDVGYQDEIKLRYYVRENCREYEIGDRVGQLMIIPRPYIEFTEVDTLDSAYNRGGGFGSTGS